MTPNPPRRSRLVPLLLTALVVAGAIGTWTLRSELGDREAAADESQRAVDELEAARARLDLAAMSFRQLTVDLGVLAGLDIDTATLDQRDGLRAAGDELERLLDSGAITDDPASIAGEVLDALDRALSPDGGFWPLEETAFVSTTPSSFGPPESPTDLALLSTVLATSPSLVVIDALALELAAAPIELPPDAADYVRSTADIVEADPGWYGPDAASPYVGGYLPGDLLEEQDPAALAALGGADGLDEVWRYDQWLIARLEAPGPAPMPLDRLFDAATTAQDQLVTRVRADLDATIAAARVDEPGPLLVAGWIGALAVSILAALALAATIASRTRRLAEVAFVDPLTGVGNRRRLDELEASWASSGGPAYAAVAVFDLDRFKLINDSLGHAVGDQVLREVGAGLRRLADGLRPDVEQIDVVRLGGDEFAVVIAAERPQVESLLHERIAAVGGVMSVGADEPVDVGLSIGVVCASHPDDLSGLLTAADLRAYEEKESRRTVDRGATPTAARA